MKSKNNFRYFRHDRPFIIVNEKENLIEIILHNWNCRLSNYISLKTEFLLNLHPT